jgi:tetratricopeptide (TPR) repeat protein
LPRTYDVHADGVSASRALGASLAVFVAVHATGAAAQTFPPPDPAQLAPGYHVDADGCVRQLSSGPAPAMLPPDDPQVHNWFLHYPSALADYRANYAESQGDLLDAVALRRHELRASTDDEAEKDAAIRLPLSIDLVRLGNIAAARRIWTDLLKRLPAFDELVFAPAAQRRLDLALQSFRLDSSINPAFEDSGAAAHLERGVNAANHHDLDRAAAEWRLALRCSPQFGLPHLLLGVADRLRGRLTDARAEWLATLGSYEPQPPGPRNIETFKYEAMSLLLADAGLPSRLAQTRLQNRSDWKSTSP